EDVDQAAGDGRDLGCHREGQADGVTRGGVGVLADDEDAHPLERLLEGAQDVPAGGKVTASGRDLLPEEVPERSEGCLVRAEGRQPRGVDELLERTGRHVPKLTCAPHTALHPVTEHSRMWA